VGIDPKRLDSIADELAEAHLGSKVELCLVMGGGNVIRGARSDALIDDRVTADHMGMLATVINSLALRDRLRVKGVPGVVMSAFEIHGVTEPYVRGRALRHLEEGRAVLSACGTGNPFFSTDTAAALRAAELGAEALLKATKVDGVFTGDPMVDSDARKLDRISYEEFMAGDLRVMDLTSVALCKENDIPIHVFNFIERGNLSRVLRGEPLGSVVRM
jgi:uridylate kinase